MAEQQPIDVQLNQEHILGQLGYTPVYSEVPLTLPQKYQSSSNVVQRYLCQFRCSDAKLRDAVMADPSRQTHPWMNSAHIRSALPKLIYTCRTCFNIKPGTVFTICAHILCKHAGSVDKEMATVPPQEPTTTITTELVELAAPASAGESAPEDVLRTRGETAKMADLYLAHPEPVTAQGDLSMLAEVCQARRETAVASTTPDVVPSKPPRNASSKPSTLLRSRLDDALHARIDSLLSFSEALTSSTLRLQNKEQECESLRIQLMQATEAYKDLQRTFSKEMTQAANIREGMKQQYVAVLAAHDESLQALQATQTSLAAATASQKAPNESKKRRL